MHIVSVRNEARTNPLRELLIQRQRTMASPATRQRGSHFSHQRGSEIELISPTVNLLSGAGGGYWNLLMVLLHDLTFMLFAVLGAVRWHIAGLIPQQE